MATIHELIVSARSTGIPEVQAQINTLYRAGRTDIQGLTADAQRFGHHSMEAFQIFKGLAIYRGFGYITQSIGEGVTAAMEFEYSLARINSLLQVSDTAIQDYGKHIAELGQTVPLALNDIAMGMYDIVSAGFEQEEEILKVLDLSARAAVAGSANIRTTIQAGIGAMNAFGRTTNDLSHIFDVQFQTVKYGIFEYDQLNQVFGRVASAGSLAGQQLESVSGALVAISRGGFGGPAFEEGATRVVNFFQELSRPKAQQDIEALGVAVFDSFGKMRDAMDIVADLNTKLATMTEEQQQAAVNQIFTNIRSAQGFEVLSKQLGVWREATLQNIFAAGATNDAFEKMANTAKATIATIQNQFTYGMTGLVDQLKAPLEWIGSIISTVGQNIYPVIIMLGALASKYVQSAIADQMRQRASERSATQAQERIYTTEREMQKIRELTATMDFQVVMTNEVTTATTKATAASLAKTQAESIGNLRINEKLLGGQLQIAMTEKIAASEAALITAEQAAAQAIELENLTLKESAAIKAYAIALDKEYNGITGIRLINLYDERNSIQAESQSLLDQNSIAVLAITKKRDAITAVQEQIAAIQASTRATAESKVMTMEEMLAHLASKEALDAETNAIMLNNTAKIKQAQTLQNQYTATAQQLIVAEKATQQNAVQTTIVQTLTAATQQQTAAFEAKAGVLNADTTAIERNNAALIQQSLVAGQAATASANTDVAIAARTMAVEAAAQTQISATAGLTAAETRKAAAVMASLQDTISAYAEEEAMQMSRVDVHATASQSIINNAVNEANAVKAATEAEISSAGYIKQSQLDKLDSAELSAAGIVGAFREEMTAAMQDAAVQEVVTDDIKILAAAREAAIIAASQANLGLSSSEIRLGATIMASTQAALTSTSIEAASQQARVNVHVQAATEIIAMKKMEIATAIEVAQEKVRLAAIEQNAVNQITMAHVRSAADIELAESTKTVAIENAANVSLGLRGSEARLGAEIMASLQATINSYEDEATAQENRAIIHANASKAIAQAAIDEAQAVWVSAQSEIAAQEKIIASHTQRLVPTTQTMGAVTSSIESANAINAETQAILDNQMAERGSVGAKNAATVATQQSIGAVIAKTQVLEADTLAQAQNANAASSSAVSQEQSATAAVRSQAAIQAAVGSTSGAMLMNNQISAARAAVINQTVVAQRQELNVTLEALGIQQDSLQAQLLSINIRRQSGESIKGEELALLTNNWELAKNITLKYNQMKAAGAMALANDQLSVKMANQSMQLRAQNTLYWLNAGGMLAMVASFGVMSSGIPWATSLLMGLSTALMLLQTLYPIVSTLMAKKTATTIIDTGANFANAASLAAVATGEAAATSGLTAPGSITGALLVSGGVAAAIGIFTGAMMYLGNTATAIVPKFDEFGNTMDSMSQSQASATDQVDKLIIGLVNQGETLDIITPKVAAFIKALNTTGSPGFAAAMGTKGFGVYEGTGYLTPKMLPETEKVGGGLTPGQWATSAHLTAKEIVDLQAGGERALAPFLKLQDTLMQMATSTDEWTQEQARLFAVNIFGTDYGQSLMILWQKYKGKFILTDPTNQKEMMEFIDNLKEGIKVKYSIEAESKSIDEIKEFINKNAKNTMWSVGVLYQWQPATAKEQGSYKPIASTDEEIKDYYAELKLQTDEEYAAMMKVSDGWLQLQMTAGLSITKTMDEIRTLMAEGIKSWSDSLTGMMKFGDVVTALTDAGAQLDKAGFYWEGEAGHWNDLGKEWTKIQKMWSVFQLMQTLMSIADSLATLPAQTISGYTSTTTSSPTEAALLAQTQIQTKGLTGLFNMFQNATTWERMFSPLFAQFRDLFNTATQTTTTTTNTPTYTLNPDYSGIRDQIYEALGPIFADYGAGISQSIVDLLSQLLAGGDLSSLLEQLFGTPAEEMKTFAEKAADYMANLSGAGGIGDAISEFVRQGASLEDAGFYFQNVAGGWEKLGEEWSRIQNMFKITNFINQITQTVASMRSWGVDIPASFEETMYNLMQVMAGSVLPNFQSIIDQLSQNLGSAEFWQALADGMANAQYTQSNNITLAPYIVIEGTEDAEAITQLVHDALVEEAKRAGFTWGNG
jgi:hypothetical protein